MIPADLARRIDVTSTDCWLWIGPLNRDGYGDAGSAARRTWGSALAHRAVWAASMGPVPIGLELDHLCRNRACVNPRHLEPVAHVENVRRQVEAKTHCVNGHPLSGENLAPWSAAKRVCLTCARASTRRAQARRRARRAVL